MARPSLTISVFTGLTNIAVTFIAIALIDRIGRRPILMTGSLGMTASLATMAIAFSQAVTVNGEISLPGAWGPIALVAVTFPSLAAVSLPLTYGMYALFAALSFVFVLTKIPETNGMSLDEANTLLPPKNTAKSSVKNSAVRSDREEVLRR